MFCHTLIPGPTRMADPNRFLGARLYTGTLYLFFFFKADLVPVGIQTISVTTKNHLHIQKNFTFQLHIQSAEPTVMNPY